MNSLGNDAMTSRASIMVVARKYDDQLAAMDEVLGEYDVWRQSFAQTNPAQLPTTAVDALNGCDEVFFPNIHFLLRVWQF